MFRQYSIIFGNVALNDRSTFLLTQMYSIEINGLLFLHPIPDYDPNPHLFLSLACSLTSKMSEHRDVETHRNIQKLPGIYFVIVGVLLLCLLVKEYE